MPKPSKNLSNKRKKRRFYKRKGFWLTLLLLGVVTAGVGYVAAERYTRPYRERASTYDLNLIDKVEKPSIIYGRDGGEIGRIFAQNRSVVGIEKVPERFVQALMAGEDKRYYKHHGVDYVGIARAAIDWMKEGEAVSGASTITQQLARGAYGLEAERRKRGESGIERKLVEAFLAMRIEKRYQKPQILEFYLNRIYFGSGYYGIRSASLGYFGKEPAELTSLECATIVGLIKNPTGLSPLNDKERCKVARDMVIDRMARLEFVSAAEAARMKASPVELSPRPLQRNTSHLYERIADELRRLLGDDALTEGGFTIRTTIDSRVQRAAERTLEESLLKAESHPRYSEPKRAGYRQDSGETAEYLQGAVLMVDHQSGAVIAHVGGRDYAEVPYDVIELGQRPLGTAFHPFVYAAALERGETPATTLDDEAMDNRAVMVGGREGILGEWGTEVPNPRYEGKITLRRGLEASKIAATVRLGTDTGLQRVVDTAGAFGLPMDEAELLPRIAVGWEAASLKEVVRAYAAFARGGSTGPSGLYYIDSIRGPSSGVVFERPMPEPVRLEAVSDATAFQVHSILQGGMDRGSAAGLYPMLVERPFAGAAKTGTTHDFSDNWFVGYNGRVACGVWVGFLQSGKTIYEGAFSRDLAMPVWAAAMNAAAPDFGGRGIPQPESIVEGEVCRVSGQRATPYCYELTSDPKTGRPVSRPAGMTEFFRKGTEKLPYCRDHSGVAPDNPAEGAIDMTQLAVIDTSPVRPTQPTLLGEDPYHSFQPTAEGLPVSRTRGSGTNVLDGFDLGDGDEGVVLPAPRRLEISPE